MKTTTSIDNASLAALEAGYVAWLQDENFSTFVRFATTLIPQENVLAQIANLRGVSLSDAARSLLQRAGI